MSGRWRSRRLLTAEGKDGAVRDAAGCRLRTELVIRQYSFSGVALLSDWETIILYLEPLAKLLGLAAWRSPQFSW